VLLPAGAADQSPANLSPFVRFSPSGDTASPIAGQLNRRREKSLHTLESVRVRLTEGADEQRNDPGNS